jgi:hypothetical protein
LRFFPALAAASPTAETSDSVFLRLSDAAEATPAATSAAAAPAAATAAEMERAFEAILKN